MSSRITAAEAAALLREILAGERGLRLRDAKRPWVRIAVGECAVTAGDAQVVFFADSASLDHVATMRVADGRAGAFADWLLHDGLNPLDLLDESERIELEHRLHEAG
ncbi:MAG: hypothetical protein M9907_11510 [Burkholderiaceae bacterium]|nr:hypothetical protein [Burkholderiaceae bacterium]